jgi:hypothetical protein
LEPGVGLIVGVGLAAGASVGLAVADVFFLVDVAGSSQPTAKTPVSPSARQQIANLVFIGRDLPDCLYPCGVKG